jgi:molybdopterin synthase sulfur carrier subunit
MKMTNLIKVKVKLFAAYQETFGQDELEVELPLKSSVINVLEKLLESKPELAKWRDITRFGVNLQFVEPDTFLNDGDEVVLIPPVSGG